MKTPQNTIATQSKNQTEEVTQVILCVLDICRCTKGGFVKCVSCKISAVLA